MVEYLRVFNHVGFFIGLDRCTPVPKGTNHMIKSNATMAQQIAQAAMPSREAHGHRPNR